MKTSQWKKKYGEKKSRNAKQSGSDASLTDLITVDAEAATSSYEQMFMPTNAESPTDKEADDVISQMNKLLDDGLPTTNNDDSASVAPFDFNEVDYNSSDFVDGQQIDFDGEENLNKYLSFPSIEDDPIFQNALAIESIDIRVEVANLFRRTHDGKRMKKVFHCLAAHSKDSKLLRSRVFAEWKCIALLANSAKDQIVRRFRRRNRLRYLRRILLSWLKVTSDKATQLVEFTEKREWQTKTKVLTVWRKQVEVETFDLAKIEAVADNFCQTKLKRTFFVEWLSENRKRRRAAELKMKKVNDAKSEQVPGKNDNTTLSVAVLIEDEDTPTKKPSKAQASSCITPERKAQPQHKNESRTDDDKENQLNNRLLQPLKPKPKRQVNPSTPKLIKDMQQRKKERETQRQILRKRYEQKAAEKKKQAEKEKLRKEEAEMKIHNEYLQRKAAEEQKKKLIAIRRKQAMLLSKLHCRMSLQRRMLLQWKRILEIRAFNERKADMSRSDTTLEKCFKAWLCFKHEEQRKRSERILVLERLADEFNNRRLLAKAFAGLEEHCSYSQSLIHEAQCRIGALRQRYVITKWHQITVVAKDVRCRKENKAAKNGRRLLLLRTMQSWHSGVEICKKEREIDILVQAKWQEVEKWLS